MRTYPHEDDADDLARLNAEPWMIEQLKLNPSYVHWGPHEDYMIVRGEGGNAPLSIASWSEFTWQLDELNECVNWYFSVNRAGVACVACDQSGYNPGTKAIADAFYAHSSPTGIGWNDQITQDEVEALQSSGRLRRWDGDARKWVDQPGLTAAEVNAANAPGAMWNDLQHDGINRMILIETRAKRLGVEGPCSKCDGHGYVFTEPAAALQLVLWMIHPRKGASRGVEVKRVERGDLPAVYEWLSKAAQRNAERFAKIVAARAKLGEV